MMKTKKNRQINEITNQQIDLFKEYLNRIQHFGFTGVVVLAKDDEILLNQGFGYQNYEEKLAMKATSSLSIGSISKQFTATMIMKSVEDAEIELSDTLEKYFSEVPADKTTITIHQLLTHTSGFNDNFGDDFEFIEENKFITQVLNSPLGSKPGEAFKYSNHGYSMLGIILQKLTGKSYQNLLLDDYLGKLGVRQAGWFGDPKWTNENSTSYYLEGENTGSMRSWKGSWQKPYWAILGNGGVCLPAIELFTWVRAVMIGNVLKDETLGQLLTPDQNEYAYGWDVVDSPHGKLVRHDGGNDIGVNAICRYYFDQGITLIIQSNIIQNGFGMAMLAEEMWANILQNPNITLPPLIDANSKASLEDYESTVKIFMNEKNHLVVTKNKIGHQSVNILGQGLLNVILDIDDEKKKIFEKMNQITNKVGLAFMKEDWGVGFEHFKNKTVSEGRLGFITKLMKMFESKYGKIVETKCTGTIPFNDFYAMSLLTFIGEKGKSGIPLIWENETTLLGFRPMFTQFPLTLPCTSLDGEIMVTSFTDQISFSLTKTDVSHYNLIMKKQIIELFIR